MINSLNFVGCFWYFAKFVVAKTGSILVSLVNFLGKMNLSVVSHKINYKVIIQHRIFSNKRQNATCQAVFIVDHGTFVKINTQTK